jgi:hypothetical protein
MDVAVALVACDDSSVAGFGGAPVPAAPARTRILVSRFPWGVLARRGSLRTRTVYLRSELETDRVEAWADNLQRGSIFRCRGRRAPLRRPQTTPVLLGAQREEDCEELCRGRTGQGATTATRARRGRKRSWAGRVLVQTILLQSGS